MLYIYKYNFKVLMMIEGKMTCTKAREISIFNLLTSIGFKPTKNKEKEAWFKSPLRNEEDASFKVSKILNRWYDHGSGIGGNTLDFVIHYKNCSVKEALEFLKQDNLSFSFHQQLSKKVFKNIKDDGITIKNVIDINKGALLNYISKRNINPDLARRFCKEVYYENNGKLFYAIGQQNVSGGWELRNKYFKSSSSPKYYSHLQFGNKTLKVVEGMFDFLTLVTLFTDFENKYDFLILNSISFKKDVLPLFKSYDSVELYLDRDVSGRKTSEFLISNSTNCTDDSDFYEHYSDLNDWHIKNNNSF